MRRVLWWIADNPGNLITALVFGFFGAMFLFSIYLAFFAVKARAEEPQEYPNCEGWISHSCCCTNECCFEVKAGDGTVEEIGADSKRFRIVATGQEIDRTAWSQDERFMRCACDYDIDTGKWIKHPKAYTRCIYPPRPTS